MAATADGWTDFFVDNTPITMTGQAVFSMEPSRINGELKKKGRRSRRPFRG